ncbi:hypothetical protein B1A87_007315 [Arthrobacter sp. KBS0703]|uniref:hypothetical protein n=1 Tax=Arthrobacter sp. KBS0703 TaxID=1955698 RepID=UPI0011163756|nr:hypothetical protein [Arthrobacter sp. KBS0703]TSE15734.1 hypothetical protein B1A87_007315 [Arthrobacter sp. KBS0703]
MVQTLTAARTEPGRGDLAVLDDIKFIQPNPRVSGAIVASMPGPSTRQMRSLPGDLKREVRGNLCGFSEMTGVRP